MFVRAKKLSSIYLSVKNFFRRLRVHVEVPPTAEMMAIMVKMIIEVPSILAIATLEMQGWVSESFPYKYRSR